MVYDKVKAKQIFACTNNEKKKNKLFLFKYAEKHQKEASYMRVPRTNRYDVNNQLLQQNIIIIENLPVNVSHTHAPCI